MAGGRSLPSRGRAREPYRYGGAEVLWVRAPVGVAVTLPTADRSHAHVRQCRVLEVRLVKRDEALKVLAAHREELRAMGVERLSLFGSVARDEAVESSDIDILVEFVPGARIGMFEFLGVQETLASLLGVEVDLATPASLHPRLRDAILGEAVLAA
jgi:predicted nucleotidyltransferase